MRHLLLLSAALLAVPVAGWAAVFTQQGTPVSAGATTESGYLLVYSFAPIALPAGTTARFSLDFTGTIRAAVGGAAGINIASGDVITSVNIVPSASFASSLIPGPSLGFADARTASLPLVNEPYSNEGNVSIASPLAISLSDESGPGVPADTFATSTLAAVTLFAVPPFGTPGTPFTVQPAGSRAFFPGGAAIDRSSGFGTLRLTVTTTDVPEPASLAVLGAGLLGVAAGRRRRG